LKVNITSILGKSKQTYIYIYIFEWYALKSKPLMLLCQCKTCLTFTKCIYLRSAICGGCFQSGFQVKGRDLLDW
jgi:hypothetical protein